MRTIKSLAILNKRIKSNCSIPSSYFPELPDMTPIIRDALIRVYPDHYIHLAGQSYYIDKKEEGYYPVFRVGDIRELAQLIGERPTSPELIKKYLYSIME